MCPPSTPISAAIFPCLRAPRTSAAVVASVISFGCLRTCSRTASICAMARSTASGPVILLGIQMEKKIAPRPPSFIRGISMLPVALRSPISNLPPRKRCVVSSCVSTTIQENCSFFARAGISSPVTAAARKAPTETHSPAVRNVRNISTLISPQRIHNLLLRLQFPADLFRLLHHSQRVPAENFANVVVTIAFAHQRFGDSRQLGAVFHSFRHCGAVKVRAEANMVRTHKFYRVIDVIHDPLPTHMREFAFCSRSFLLLSHLPAKAFLVVAAFFFELVKRRHHPARQFVRSILIGLVNKTPLVVDLDDATLRGQRFNHVVR